jgi:hypothetical protein
LRLSVSFAEAVPAETFIDNVERVRFGSWVEHETSSGWLVGA